MKTNKEQQLDHFLEQQGIAYEVDEQQVVRKIIRRQKRYVWRLSLLLLGGVLISGFTTVKILPEIYEHYFGAGASQLISTEDSFLIESNGVTLRVLDTFKDQGVNYAALQIEAETAKGKTFNVPVTEGGIWHSVENEHRSSAVVLSTLRDRVELTALLSDPQEYRLEGTFASEQLATEVEWLENVSPSNDKSEGIRSDLLAFDEEEPYALTGYAMRDEKLHVQFYGRSYGKSLASVRKEVLEEPVFLINQTNGEKILPVDSFQYSKTAVNLEVGDAYYLEYIFELSDVIESYSYVFEQLDYQVTSGEWLVDFSDSKDLPTRTFQNVETEGGSFSEPILSPIALSVDVFEENPDVEIVLVKTSGEEILLNESHTRIESKNYYTIPYTLLSEVAYLKIDRQISYPVHGE
ncbi:hypothetical protein [Enterococcus olivae]